MKKIILKLNSLLWIGLLILSFSMGPLAIKGICTPYQKATLGGGCFWCMEPPFDKLAGVISTTSGYMGGSLKNPTYHEVSAGGSGHAEVVQVIYNPQKISYQKLLETYWRNINPTQKDGQFADHGRQYRSVIFYHNETQRKLAEISKKKLEKSGKFDSPIVTEITPASTFYPAEEYHQNYYQKNPYRYKFYRFGSGRDSYLKKTWGEEKH